MISDHLLPPELYNLLQNHYNIVGVLKIPDFDFDISYLTEFFTKNKKSVFAPNDRFIIQHQDTDIYIKECSVGINLRNLFQVLIKLDIPLYTLIIWTNHYGLQKELDIFCKDRHPLDRPTLLESFSTILNVGSYGSYCDLDISIDQIKMHALSMMGRDRSHRFALYNVLKNLDSNRVAVSIEGLTL